MFFTTRDTAFARIVLALIWLTGVLGAAPAAAASVDQTITTSPLLISLVNGQTIGDVLSADEDILKFDGQTWELFFDGSDVGLDAADVFAFSMIDSDSLLLAFTSAVTVNGITVAPQDVVRFDATSLGATTVGTFSMYFDGSDVGLTTATESLDAISLLNNGRLLISTTGNPTVTGVSASDEDVLAFTATSFGSTTTGSWSLYFDGSDVGLADTADEDVDALDVTSDGMIYLSTLGNFAVTGVSGADEDVFACAITTIGSVTACTYSTALYFDGSVWGLSENDVDALHILASVSTPTVVPTATLSSTPSLIPSVTSTATATQTIHPTVTNATIVAATNSVPADTLTPTSLPTASATLQPTKSPIPTYTYTSVPTSTPIPTYTFTPAPTYTVVPASATPTVSMPPMGPLTVSAVNPRYFADPNGKIVYLTGSHTWCNFMDCDDTAAVVSRFSYDAYLDFLQANNHNFFRLWRAENSRGGEAGPNFWFDPMPYQRSTTCCAFDGGNKFDLTQFNQSYFDRMREHVIDAREHGMYVAILLFDGWSVESKFGGHEPWPGHPFNSNNNINNMDGDLNNDNQGSEMHTLALPEITALQEAYVRKVIDTVNDLDNVLYEISNESPADSETWQYHMISVIRNYEATKPQSHPIGITWEWPGGNNTDLYNSPADWISLGGNVDLTTYIPPAADGAKIILADTDHLCGICGTRQWVWKSFTRGENPIFMDIYDNATSGRGMPFSNPAEAEVRVNLGYTRAYADRIDLETMSPQPALCSTGYCLANASPLNAEYLAFLPNGGTISMDLSATQGTLAVEWFNPAIGVKFNGGTVNGGVLRQLTPPFSGDAVLYLYALFVPTPTSSPLPSFTPISTATAPATVVPTFTPTEILACTATPVPTGTSRVVSTTTSTVVPMNTVLPTNTITATLTKTALPASTFTKTSTYTPTLTRTATIAATQTSTVSPSSSFPYASIQDTFDRVNGSVGSNWSGFSSAFRIASNKLGVNAVGWDTYMLWKSTSFGADQEAFVTLTQLDTNSDNEHSLVLKSQSSTSSSSGLLYIQYSHGSKTVQVWTYHPSQGWVQYGANIPVTFANGDQFGARARANGTVEIYRNGMLIGSRSVTSWPYYVNGGYIGLWFVNAPNALADNFGGGTITP